MQNKNIVKLLMAVIVLTLFSGCSILPPPSKNSFTKKDEVTGINMLTKDQIEQSEYKDDWCKAFGAVLDSCPLEKPAVTTVLPPDHTTMSFLGTETIVTAGVTLAVSAIGKTVKKAAKNHLQQFAAKTFGTDFWINPDTSKTALQQKYYGFEVLRKNGKTKDDYYKLVYGIATDPDGYMWVAPIYFQTQKAKAKVSGFSLKPRLNSTVELSIDSVWVDAKKKYHYKTIAPLTPLAIKKYNLKEQTIFRASCSDKDNKDNKCKPLKGTLDPFMGVPVSSGSNKGETGTFWISALVTESDAGKAEKHLTSIADSIKDSEEDIVEGITEAITPAE